MKDFANLKRNLKKDASALKPIKVALLGDIATQFLSVAIRGVGYEHGYNLQLWEADFNQVERQVFDPASELHAYDAEVIIIFRSSHKLLGKYNKYKGNPTSFAADELNGIKSIYDTLASVNPKVKVIYYNYAEIDDSVFGNYANKVAASFLFQLRKLNFLLMEYATEVPNLHVCDLSSVQNQVGKATFFQPSVYINSEMVLSIEVLPAIAYKTQGIISALQGKFNKCLILDLDNTTWGGIIGDDGIENIQIGALGIGKAFSEFQYWVKKLKQRGIIVAVCSKNTESIAREPFEKHPDMVLKLDDIAVFVANWENKVDNIRKIQGILNIGFDSMVFLDDNPFERNMVREGIPQLTVPELPEDPAEYLEYLYPLNLFETVSFTNDDAERTRQYQVEAQRATLFEKFTNEDDFLQNLAMVSVVEPFTRFNTPRVAQLSQRSNQFNLRTVRYTEADLEALAASADYHTFSFTLEDKFGNNGLICVLILQQESPDVLFIDTWLMSCRVLKRGMENFTLNTIANFAQEKGYKYLKGEYIATAKNAMVEQHYGKLGFEPDGAYWLLNLAQYQPQKAFIDKK
ncbi:HAD-IIIC family phosphatase [Mucilaginibacter psychrotolerans]|uniref:HAD-IIIC family phosphatase n=1 Tax=Mucilaginibacter psychrotolerans TaxID=1524096 RepID=A0A4Y8SEM9_9SPHI|nr:HAD-IIIC family phosphatase [Mucilaginibacter psychrotolerans]TFF37090.1 HAD-IIIC family phosphatase [Mucilaginibacter psychrotolerans]